MKVWQQPPAWSCCSNTSTRSPARDSSAAVDSPQHPTSSFLYPPPSSPTSHPAPDHHRVPLHALHQAPLEAFKVQLRPRQLQGREGREGEGLWAMTASRSLDRVSSGRGAGSSDHSRHGHCPTGRSRAHAHTPAHKHTPNTAVTNNTDIFHGEFRCAVAVMINWFLTSSLPYGL